MKKHGYGSDGLDELLDELERSGVPVVRTDIIHRADVESLNLTPYLSPWLYMLRDRDAVIRGRQQLRPSVYGYEADPRELFQIEEVRTFLSRIDQSFPYWFYFVDPECGFLRPLMACLCPLIDVSFSADHSTVRYSFLNTDAAAFLDRHFAAMDRLFDRFHLDDGDSKLNERMIAQVVKALAPKAHV